MGIDLAKGISFKIEGELGKNNTLSIDKLIEISQSFQDLIFSIVKNDIAAEHGINPDNFKLELSDFSPGSAIPTFTLTKNVQNTFHSYQTQKEELEVKLDGILNTMNLGNYDNLANKYLDFGRRNEMVESIYNFSKSFNNSPVTIGTYNKQGNDFKPKYHLKKFKSEVKNALVVKVEKNENSTEETVFAEIRITKQSNKRERKTMKSTVKGANHSLSYSPTEIIINHRIYKFNFPLRCLFKMENGVYLIQNEMIDIIGTGDSQEEAELSFKEEFDYLYNRLNDFDGNHLTERMQNIKNSFKIFIESVSPYGS
jgi:hypothetical protein